MVAPPLLAFFGRLHRRPASCAAPRHAARAGLPGPGRSCSAPWSPASTNGRATAPVVHHLLAGPARHPRRQCAARRRRRSPGTRAAASMARRPSR
eukprot:4354958-Prymnesium_polylepis.1